VVGNTGDERRLKLAVVGDTVNVASRLERLTRTLGAALVVSVDLLSEARLAGAPVALCGRFTERSSLPLRGCEHALAVMWQRRSTAMPAAATNS
jgi:adenylate cyclase